MRRKLGIVCVLLGITCILASLSWMGYNRLDEQNAAHTADVIRENVKEQIEKLPSEEEKQGQEVLPQEMPTMQTDGYDCIGVLSIPVLALELPVLTDWSYEKLKAAPCLYYGNYYEADFVIAAHNYTSHFGRISRLQPQDLIFFTDVNGVVRCYEVVLTETLPADATKEMITSGFDLSLFTCTLGRGSRVTVRCNAVENQMQRND